MLSAVVVIAFVASASCFPRRGGVMHSVAAVIFISPLRAFKIDLGVPAGAGRPLGPDWLRRGRRDLHLPAAHVELGVQAGSGRPLRSGWLPADLEIFPDGRRVQMAPCLPRTSVTTRAW